MYVNMYTGIDMDISIVYIFIFIFIFSLFNLYTIIATIYDTLSSVFHQPIFTRFYFIFIFNFFVFYLLISFSAIIQLTQSLPFLLSMLVITSPFFYLIHCLFLSVLFHFHSIIAILSSLYFCIFT